MALIPIAGLAVIHRALYKRFYMCCCVGFDAGALCQVKTIGFHEDT